MVPNGAEHGSENLFNIAPFWNGCVGTPCAEHRNERLVVVVLGPVGKNLLRCGEHAYLLCICIQVFIVGEIK